MTRYVTPYKEWLLPKAWDIRFYENYKRDRDLKWNDYQNIVRECFEKSVIYGSYKPKIILKQKNIFKKHK
jgi:hypothetical protein